MRGIFITLEGADGCGKSTQAALLADRVEAAGREVVRLREPGGTPISEKIRALVLDPANGEMCPECELLLFEAARAQLVRQVIEPALARGAVVVCDGEVVARAHNRRETDLDPSAHAEFSAMVAASEALGRWRLSGCTVYVTLEPCLMCAGLMVNARIDRCVYGAADPKGGALGTLYDVSHDERLNHEFEVTAGVLADEAAEQLRSFFRARRAALKKAKSQA